MLFVSLMLSFVLGVHRLDDCLQARSAPLCRDFMLGEMPSDAVRHQGSCNILSKMGELIFDALYAVAGGALQRLSDL